jgi:hypothetical protein
MLERPRALFASLGFEAHDIAFFGRSHCCRLDVVSDSLIVLSYHAIPIALIRFARKK